MPQALKTALEAVVEEDCRSEADWIVVTVQRALASYASEHPLNLTKRRPVDTDRRLTVRIPWSMKNGLHELVALDDGPPSLNDFILFVIERAIAERAALKKP